MAKISVCPTNVCPRFEIGIGCAEMPALSHPHDRLFRALLDQAEIAGALIREWLPAEVVALLTDDPPEREDGSFVDETLKGSQTDRLFRAKLKTGGDLLLYILFDHKSTAEPGVLLQLLGYLCRIWVRRAEGKAERFRNLPPILPVVVYHGAAAWTVSLSLRDTIAAPAEISALQPEFRYSLIDLGPIPDRELSAYPPLRAGLLALKYSHRESDAETVLVQVFSDAKDLPPLFRMLVAYTTAVYRDVTPVTLRKVIRRVRPEWEEEMVSIAARQWMAEGREKGHAEGRAEMLLCMFRRKFGEVPDAVDERVRDAGIDQLDQWGERFVDAATLDQVFAADRPE